MKSTDVAKKKFRPVKWAEGYDVDQVDAFLDRVQATLAAHERGGAGASLPDGMLARAAAAAAGSTGTAVPADGLCTPEDVVGARFAPTKFRQGYHQGEVDDFLDEVVAALRSR